MIEHIIPESEKLVDPQNVNIIKNQMDQLIPRTPESIFRTDIPLKIYHRVNKKYDPAAIVSPVRDSVKYPKTRHMEIFHEIEDAIPHSSFYVPPNLDERHERLNNRTIAALTNIGTKVLTNESRGGAALHQLLKHMNRNPKLTFTGYLNNLQKEAKNKDLNPQQKKDIENHISHLLIMGEEDIADKLTPEHINFLHNSIPTTHFLKMIEEPYHEIHTHSNIYTDHPKIITEE